MPAKTPARSAVRTRAALQALVPYAPGRDVEAVRRDTGYAGSLIKLASNEGAEGPFPAALAAMHAALGTAQRYPESAARTLRQALAEYHGVGIESVLVGAGGCGVLQQLVSAMLEPDDEVAYCSPSFHLYRLESLRAGAHPRTAPLDRLGAYDLQALSRIVTARTKLLIVCTPNNPTGGLLDRDALRAFLESLPAHVLPVIDEAYFEYVDSAQYPNPERYQAPAARPAVVLRTFSKMYGLAGLRVGYAIAPPDIVEAYHKVASPYEVNSLAQAAAIASLDSPAELQRRILANRSARAQLASGLQALGFRPLPSQANFVCVRVGQALPVARALELRGYIVRPVDAMGDKGSIRVTVGTPEQMRGFLSAFAAVVADGLASSA